MEGNRTDQAVNQAFEAYCSWDANRKQGIANKYNAMLNALLEQHEMGGCNCVPGERDCVVAKAIALDPLKA